MRVIKAEEMGICIGIKRAFSMLKDVWMNNHGQMIFIYGDLAHNSHVMDSLRKHGFKTIYRASDAVKGSTVIIRAHGISDRERASLVEKGVNIVDATCPLVKKNQDIMRSSEFDVLLLGIKGHSETIAVEGTARRNYYVIQDRKDLDNVPKDRKYRVIVQTTLESGRYERNEERTEYLQSGEAADRGDAPGSVLYGSRMGHETAVGQPVPSGHGPVYCAAGRRMAYAGGGEHRAEEAA